jgi:hypothetical protein
VLFEAQKKNQRKMLKKKSFYGGKTWWFGRISNLYISQRLYG